MRKSIYISIIFMAVAAVAAGGYAFVAKYHKNAIMTISVEEVTAAEYPEDPSIRSVHYDKYSGRRLKLVQRKDHHFDFILESNNPKAATIIFKNIDLSLMVPVKPVWLPKDQDLEVVALTEREWNRQQVRFSPDSPHLEVHGGDGFERRYLHTAELARNCLNAGLWEIHLYTMENGNKSLYYQGWFDFPLGHYKTVFEDINKESYWKHWYRLEHWVSPEGRKVDLAKLRHVIKEAESAFTFIPKEVIAVQGEQKRKAKEVSAQNLHCYGDLCLNSDQVSFNTFIPPGRYSADHEWGNELHRIANLYKVVTREIRNRATREPLHEFELYYRSSETQELTRIVVSGVDLDTLPTLSPQNYHKGFYMPMGIAVPPFSQGYEDLKDSPPQESPYFSVMLDGLGRWLDHHAIAIDGPVMFRDSEDLRKIHLYLLSYERHTLVAHYILPDPTRPSSKDLFTADAKRNAQNRRVAN